MTKTIPRIAISMGDPAGIGPEIIIKALANAGLREQARWLIVGDRGVLIETASSHALPVPEGAMCEIRDMTPAECTFSSGVPTGRVDAGCGKAALAFIQSAVAICKRGDADALVTAPVNKESISLTTPGFRGHTEYIGSLCNMPDTRMLLVNERFSVAHVTTHVSLREACNINMEDVLRTIEMVVDAMTRMGVSSPRIGVCGLNPHASENGLFGNEESGSITPAIAIARGRGINATGPHPADTVFVKAMRGYFDVVVAMYHDQGHIPMKIIDFQNTVNVSLGLPIIRTSVDHGTAFDIAGTGQADATNMMAAIKAALRLIRGCEVPNRIVQ